MSIVEDRKIRARLKFYSERREALIDTGLDRTQASDQAFQEARRLVFDRSGNLKAKGKPNGTPAVTQQLWTVEYTKRELGVIRLRKTLPARNLAEAVRALQLVEPQAEIVGAWVATEVRYHQEG